MSDEAVQNSIFARIARGEVPVAAVYEDEHTIVFPDVAPQAPVHLLAIPKQPRENALSLDVSDSELAGRLILAAVEAARLAGLARSGFRIVMNTGADGGQTVPYLHAHILGARPMSWPPG